MDKNRKIRLIIYDILGVLLTSVIFLIPFYFLVNSSFKSVKEAYRMELNLPSSFHIIENFKEVLQVQNGIVIRAFLNSLIITIFSVLGLVIVCSMAGFVIQRRKNRLSGLWNFMILLGLIVPPAIVPTIWVLNALNIFGSLPSMILLEIAFFFPFSTLMYKGFMTTIPKEIDEAAILDGCGGLRLFFQIIFPLLKPVNITIIVLTAVFVYGDFMNPLYFLPGPRNATVQLTLFYFMGQYASEWNLLFADVVLVTIPPLILFLFLNRQIIAGMIAGSLKE